MQQDEIFLAVPSTTDRWNLIMNVIGRLSRFKITRRVSEIGKQVEEPGEVVFVVGHAGHSRSQPVMKQRPEVMGFALERVS
jgi:hypothetical protein